MTAPRMTLPLAEVPFSASVVDQSTLRDLPRSIAIDEPMKLVPGVKIDNQANGARVHLSIRGQGILTERGIRGIKILYDGIPVNDPTGFAPDFFDVDFHTVDRIEVLRGAAASLYGGSASGGIINILSRNSPLSPLAGEASMTFGSNNFWKGFGQIGGNFNPVNYRVSFSRMLGDGYRQHTHFWGDNVYAKAIYTPTGSVSITPILGWTSVFHENPEGITLDQFHEDPRQANSDAIPFNEFLQTERVTGGVAGSIVFNKNHALRFNGYVKRTLFTEANNRTFTYRTLSTPGATIQYTLTTGNANGEVNNRLDIGSDLQWQTIDEHRVDNLHTVPGDTVRSRERIMQAGTGLFIIDKFSFGTFWNAMLSVRYDNIHNELSDLLRSPYNLSGSTDFEKITARIGLTWSPKPQLNLFANWGEGFLPPATEELAQNPDHFGGFNAHLVPATSKGIELGIRGALEDHSISYDVTTFYLTTENDFDRYRINDPLRIQETFYRNVGSSRRIGIESFVRYSPLVDLDIQMAYTYSNFKYTNSEAIRVLMDDTTIQKFILNGNRLPNSPEHQLAVDCRYHFPWDLALGFSVEAMSKTFIDGANRAAEAADGYLLIHFRVNYELTFCGFQGLLSFQIRNLTDQQFVAFTEPDPGGNAYQPGAGREFFGGLKIQM